MTDLIAVTGATGFVGGATVRALRRRGVPVVELVTRPSNATQRRLDFRDPSTHAAGLAGVGSLFVLRPPALGNVARDMVPFLKAALAAGVSRVVLLSVAGAERRAYLPHAKLEAFLAPYAQNGLKLAVLRPGFFAQNLLSAYRRDVVERDDLVACAGNAPVAFVDTDDVGAVAAAALHNGCLDGQAVTLTGPAAVTFEDVARALSARLGRSIRYRDVSAPGFLWHRLAFHRDAALQTLIVTALHVALRRGDSSLVDPALGALLHEHEGRGACTVEDVIARSSTLLGRHSPKGIN